MKTRLRKIIVNMIILLAMGITYLVWCRVTGLYIPCIFRSVTGLYCPGCGITHMFVALSNLDFAEAYRCNAVVLVLLPIWLVLLFDVLRQYVLNGTLKLSKLQNLVLWLSLCCLGVFFLIRNVSYFKTIFLLIKFFTM